MIKIMKYNDVYKRLFIIYTIVLLISIAALDIYFIYYSKSNLKEQQLYLNQKMIEDIELDLIKNSNSSERIINGIYNQEFIAEDVIRLLNNNLTSYLKSKLDYLSSSEQKFYNGVERYVSQVFSQYKELINIEFISYSRQESIKFDSNNVITTNNLEKTFVEYIQKQSIISSKNKISYVKEIRDINTLKTEGLMVLTYSTNNIRDIIDSYGYDAIIVNKNGEVIYDSEEDYNQEKLLKYIQSTGLSSKGYIKLGKNTYDLNILMDKSGNIILGRVDRSKAVTLPINYYVTLIFIDILVILIAVFIIHLKMIRLSERMDKIIQAMSELKDGNLDVKIDIKEQKDELTLIAEQFNSMCVDLKSYIDISYLAEMKKKEAELTQKKAEMSALQSKINPHFLYNTLESIRMKAICSGDRDVGRMLYLLAKLFRSQLKEDEVITIGKEIQYCKDYLELFKYRYDDKLVYYIDYDEKLLDYSIIKFALQPIIENYIIHGIRREDYDNEVRIEIFEKNNCIRIVITDNGKGMRIDKIKEMNKKIYNRDFSGKSIGILNTNERILLQYGNGYGIYIDENFKKGTRIIYNLPMRGI